MDTPSFTPIGKVSQHKRLFLIDQFPNDLFIDGIGSPLALAEQDITGLPIDRNHIGLHLAAPVTADRVRREPERTTLALIDDPLPRQLFPCGLADKGT